MNYSEMSDAQISTRVGEFVSRDGLSMIGANGKAFIHHYSAPVGDFGELCLGWKEFDPCNSWADAGPIIQEHGITVACYKKLKSDAWCSAKGLVGGVVAEHENPLRAAMEVFLMMQEQPDAA